MCFHFVFQPTDMSAPNSTPIWEAAHPPTDVPMDPVDKVIKKVRTINFVVIEFRFIINGLTAIMGS